MATPFASQGHSDDQEKLRQIEGSPPERPKIGTPKPALPKIRGGFECEFVERPPDILQSDCPVCLLIIREPKQVTCCGYSFCRACIERVVASKKPCPTCNEAEFDVFPDKRLQRSLYQFRVRCEHQKEGCEWSGELGQLDKHLNENPGLGNQLDGCEFTRVACIHCVQFFERRLVTAHQIGSCPRRPFSCDYCGDYGADFEDVVTKHWPVCGYRPVPCPNECGVYPERRNVHDHVNKDCPLTLVSCDFHYAGCQVRLPRRDILSHLNENLSSHMALLGAHSQQMAEMVMEKDEAIRRLTNELSKEVEENKRKINELENENQALRNSLGEEIAELKKAQESKHTVQVRGNQEEESRRAQEVAPRGVLSRFRKGAASNNYEVLKQEVAELSSNKQEKLLSYVPTFPIDITMTDFEKHKRDGCKWFSDPFYTHPYGYKVCLDVKANGSGSAKGTHVSVFICLMRGEFDNHLRWPLQAHFAIRLLNQLEDREHCEMTIRFSTTSDPRFVARVTRRERARGWGIDKVIPHSELSYKPAKNCQYLKDDCLRFQVTRVFNLEYTASRVYTDAIVPPIELTLTNFSQWMENSEVWYSLPFYTHVHGYRMCLGVYANGRGSAKGTHVSVCVCLMHGELDNSLKWPFRGDVTIQLLNQLNDKEHHVRALHFNDATPDTSAGRVTTGERGGLWGYNTFIHHRELKYNSAKNCEYDMDDCLCFRVTKVQL